MTNQELIKLNELESEIKEVKYFLTTLGLSDKQWHEHKNAFISIETKRTIQLFASRSFGCGSHNSNIIIPKILLEDIIKSAESHLLKLENEFNK